MKAYFAAVSLTAGLLSLPVCVSALEPLPEFKAPLKKIESGREYTGPVKFDPQNLTFHYGSKKIAVQQNGTVGIYSGTRQLAKAVLFISTPFKKYQRTTDVKKVSGKFGKPGMHVREVRTTGDSVVIEGALPWNVPGKEPVFRKWKLEAGIHNGKQVRIRAEYELPEKNTFDTDAGIIVTFYEAKECSAGKLGSWIPGRKSSCSSPRPAPIQISYPSAADDFTLIPSKWRAWALGNASDHLRLDFTNTPGKAEMNVVIDPGKAFEENYTIRNASEVMKFMDDLTVPVRGKNLIPNPYFAVRNRFLLPAGQDDAWDADFYSTDAKFGRYSWAKPGWNHCFANIPLDAGDYVLSYYAKGKGKVTVMVQSIADRSMHFLRKEVDSPGKWTRYELPFRHAAESAVFLLINIPEPVVLTDGFQLERGKKATAFEAPAVEAGETRPFFFRSGEGITLEFELSTLEKEVSGTGEMSIKNFFGETVFTQTFRFNAAAGQYPKLRFKPGRLPDGVYVVKLDYGGFAATHGPGGMIGHSRAPEQFYRMAVMPVLKNTHQTARVFSLGYEGHREVRTYVSEKYLARLQAIGIASQAHCRGMTPEVQRTFLKYGVVPFDLGLDWRGDSKALEQRFPKLKNLPKGRHWFFLRDKSKHYNDARFGILPDYRLTGGWNEAYRKKFVETVVHEVRKFPKYPAYYFASEGPHEVKDDAHYPEMFAAFREAVKSVYPDAWVYEGGEPNMDLDKGIPYTEKLLRRLKGKAKTDFVNAHTYTKDQRKLYPNFRGFVAMLKRNPDYAESKIALAEGMHFYPYHISRWNTEPVCWNGEGWVGPAPSYDLGWREKISAAYYARAWLVYLTEFRRLWCGTAGATSTGNFVLDASMSPRAFQKIPNTLGVLLGNPKRYIGDFTFAPGTKCLVWEDGHGCPLAAVWNEDPALDNGYKDAPKAKLDYPGAEYIDLMGVKRKPPENGEFALSSFPLFIRGKKGDFDNFTKALSAAVLDDPDRLPCRLGFEIVSADRVKLTLTNQVSRELKGTLTVFGKEHAFTIPRTGESSLLVQLPKPIRADQTDCIQIPCICKTGGRTFSRDLKLHCFMVKKFTGDWSRIPAIRLNRLTTPGKPFADGNFSASYQLAWDKEKLFLRVQVKDDVFSPGSKPGYRLNDDVLQVFFDTRCSALRTGKEGYDDDDYEYGFMPTADGKRCEVWRARSPDIQLTLGIGAPKDNSPAPEIPAKFIRTSDGYIYEAEFPANYLLPMKLEAGYNFAFGLSAADRDRKKEIENGLSNASKPGADCRNQPQLWPVGILAE